MIRIATLSLSGCFGCHMSVIDAGQRFIDLLGKAELVSTPVTEGEECPECDLLLVEGAIGTERDAEVLVLGRERATTLVAVGSCAAFGGIGALRNLSQRRTVVARAYGEGSELGRDGGDGSIPELIPRVRPVGDLVQVDAAIPGCSPTSEALLDALEAVVEGRPLPVAGRRNLCAECSRKHVTMLEHSRDFVADAVYSVMELEEVDPDRCLVEQGVICMGTVTREGCGARCVSANIPCRGCMGPANPEFEQGGKMVDSLAAVLPAGAIMFLDDLMGTGYRFSLPVSVLPTIFDDRKGGDDV